MNPTAGIDPRLLAHRREAVVRHPTQQGVDRVEVAPGGPGQLTLSVYFLPGEGAGAGKPRRPDGIGPAAFQILGLDADGQQVPQARLHVVEASLPAAPDDAVLVTLNAGEAGGRSAFYTLRLVGVPDVDPFFAAAPFTTDPVRQAELPAAAGAPPAQRSAVGDGAVVDYLARDYAGVRVAMLDRLATLMPTWQGVEPADVMHTLVEVLATAADHLSYYQDAVATEAYLGTARRRVSVRRHARLLDYVLHEGCNARVWAELVVDGGPPVLLPVGTRLLTRVDGVASVLLDGVAVGRAVAAGAEVFETMHDQVLLPDLSAMPLYDWGLSGFELPVGATEAAIRGEHPDLLPGTVLVLHAAPGSVADGLGQPRVCAVRLSAVEPAKDPLGDRSAGLAITRVTWLAADALPMGLPVSAPGGGPPGWAQANVVLADHGCRLPDELLAAPDRRQHTRLRARLSSTPVTWREDYPDDAPARPASGMVVQDPALAAPAVRVSGAGLVWSAQADLLASDRRAPHFVVEVEDDGVTQLRFGDGVHGRPVAPETVLHAAYRVGTGSAGNIGRETLAHLAPPSGQATDPALLRVSAVTNPLPAVGGTDPEPIERAKLLAPHAFSRQRRCAVEEDFVAIAESHPGVRRAVAGYRWSGSWLTAVVVVDRSDGLPVDAEFRQELLAWFEPYRMAGNEIDVRGPGVVQAEIVVQVGVADGLRVDLVERDLLTAFGSGLGPDGARQFFHPVNFGIGDPLYLSQVVARAATVPGVAWADVQRFQRLGQPPTGELAAGLLGVGPQQVLRVAAGNVAFVMVGER